jgi:hypothetical protein
VEALREGGFHSRFMKLKVISMDASALRNDGWAVGVLRSQDMLPGEIRGVLSTDDPDLVHRYLELHGERLDEWLVDQRRTLAALEAGPGRVGRRTPFTAMRR